MYVILRSSKLNKTNIFVLDLNIVAAAVAAVAVVAVVADF